MMHPLKNSLAERGGALILACLAPLALAGCGDDEASQADLEQLDAQLTQGDPAVEGDLDEQILVDPELAGASLAEGDGSAADLSSMKLMSAGKAKPMSDEELDVDCDKEGECGELTQDISWAAKMPKAFPVFPNAKVEGAAGIDDGECNVRGTRFVTENAMQEIADYYFTRAKKAGYSAEYIVNDGKYALGGTREADDAAYYITLSARNGGGTIVEIVASQGS